MLGYLGEPWSRCEERPWVIQEEVMVKFLPPFSSPSLTFEPSLSSHCQAVWCFIACRKKCASRRQGNMGSVFWVLKVRCSGEELLWMSGCQVKGYGKWTRVETFIHKARERVHRLRGGRSASPDDLKAWILTRHCLFGWALEKHEIFSRETLTLGRTKRKSGWCYRNGVLA